MDSRSLGYITLEELNSYSIEQLKEIVGTIDILEPSGTKQWIVIDPKQKASLYISEDSMYEFGGYSDIDVDDVDLKKYPQMRNVEYARVILDKGDCIYMPSGMSTPDRGNI